MLLVSGATDTVRRYSSSPYLGRFVQPRNGNSLAELAGGGQLFAADNDCFQGLDPDAYLRMLDGLAAQDTARLLWVAVPDVVADWHSTRALFRYWVPALIKRQLPVALVAQDGAQTHDLPWDEIDALFIGGSTRWKKSGYAARLMRQAKQRGKWVHVGRVNADFPIRAFHALGADSFDGTKYSKWPDTYIPATLQLLAALGPNPQPSMRKVTLHA